MRTILAAAFVGLAMLALGSGGASAQMNYPWCSVTSGMGTQCTHPTRGNCEFNVQGIGGWCTRNPGFRPDHPMGQPG